MKMINQFKIDRNNFYKTLLGKITTEQYLNIRRVLNTFGDIKFFIASRIIREINK